MTAGDHLSKFAEASKTLTEGMDRIAAAAETIADALNTDGADAHPGQRESVERAAAEAAPLFQVASVSARRLADQLDRLQRIVWAHSPPL